MTYEEMSDDPQIKKDITQIKESLTAIEITLRGNVNSDEPGGIVYNVSRNTQFRKNINKIIWVLFAANAGIIIHYILKKIGG